MGKKLEQPKINIGLVGHVDHGKTTLTEKFSGKWTDTHSEELKKGITIRLGYADTSIYYCKKCDMYTIKKKCPNCNEKSEFVRKISFVDAPGHESLMATMLAGTTIMDGALLLIDASADCPQPQTREHLMALKIIGIKNIIIVQNKIDLVSKEEAIKNYKKIRKFLKESEMDDIPIIPVSALTNTNIDELIRAIEKYVPTPKRDEKQDPIMYVARSFDINKPGTKIEKITGGVLGGALVQGKLCEGDKVEILPGVAYKDKNKVSWKPIKTKITAIKTGGESVECVVPGGSIGVMTSLDPSIVKSDSLIGCVIGKEGKLPPVLEELKLKVDLLDRVVGLKEEAKVKPIAKGEVLMLNVNSAATVGVVSELKGKKVKCRLKKPVAAKKGSRVTISRMLGSRFRLIGFGIIN